MLSSMEEGVMAVDRAGTVLSVNEPCAELLGVQPERLRGRSVYEVLRKPDLLKFIENAQASPRSLDADLRFFSPEERWLHAHGTALHDATGQTLTAHRPIVISAARRHQWTRRASRGWPGKNGHSSNALQRRESSSVTIQRSR